MFGISAFLFSSFWFQQQQAQQSSNASKKSEKKTVKRGAEDENPEDYIDPETALGDKKLMSSQMAKQYNPTAVEKSWVLILALCQLSFNYMKCLSFMFGTIQVVRVVGEIKVFCGRCQQLQTTFRYCECLVEPTYVGF